MPAGGLGQEHALCRNVRPPDGSLLLSQIVQFYKEKKLSANLPYKVQFQIAQEDGAKPVKLIAHLVSPHGIHARPAASQVPSQHDCNF